MLESTSSERKHHCYSPSKLHSLECCPCYESRDSTNERAIAGTLAHGITETGRDDNRVSDEDAAAAAECMDFIAKRKETMPGCSEMKETYLPVDDCEFDGVRGTTAGYIDAALISADLKYAELADWKFGRWPVEHAAENLQGIAYTLGLMKVFPTLERVTFFFKQPHLDSISSATFTRAQMPELYLRIQVVVARAHEARKRGDFATANPTSPNCNFCANLGICPKVEALALKVGQKFFPLEVPADITPTKLHDRQGTKLCMMLAAVVKTWAEAFRARVNDRVIRREQDIPEGFIIHENHGDRKIADMEKFKQAALTYITPEELASTADYTFGSIEKIIQDKTARGSKKATLDEFRGGLESSGAVVRGQPYSFLKAVPVKKTEPTTNTERTQTNGIS